MTMDKKQERKDISAFSTATMTIALPLSLFAIILGYSALLDTLGFEAIPIEEDGAMAQWFNMVFLPSIGISITLYFIMLIAIKKIKRKSNK